MVPSDSSSFARYGKAFQEGLAQLIFEDRAFAEQITEVLDVSFLELEYLRVFVKKIVNYRAKYNTHPSVDAFIAILRADLENENEIIQTQIFYTYITLNEHYKTNIITMKINSS